MGNLPPLLDVTCRFGTGRRLSDHRGAGFHRRIRPVPVHPDGGQLTEPKAGARPRRRDHAAFARADYQAFPTGGLSSLRPTPWQAGPESKLDGGEDDEVGKFRDVLDNNPHRQPFAVDQGMDFAALHLLPAL